MPRKKTTKKRTKKKKTTRKRVKTKDVVRTGRIKNISSDRKRKAKKPGWRKSKSGRTYYESRYNRSDMVGGRV